MEPIQIVIADDHALVRAGLMELMKTFEKVEVVAEAGDGLEAIEKARDYQPDIMLLDISMPKMRGLEAITEIHRVSPETLILILSMFNNQEYIRESFKKGAVGYLLKEAAAEELKSAISALLQNKVYISPALSGFIVRDWVQSHNVGSETRVNESSPLTERERGVMKLLAEGYTNKEVAGLLHISSKTVETHRHRIMEKLKLDNFAALVKYAIKEKMVDL